MAREAGRKTGRRRRDAVRTRGSRVTALLNICMDSPTLWWGTLISMVFILICTAVADWARTQPNVGVGRVAFETHTVRVEFTTEDRQATRQEQETARQRTPWVYEADLPVLEEIRSSLENLPETFGGTDTLDDVASSIRERIPITREQFDAIKALGADDAELAAWQSSVRQLMSGLRVTPLLLAQDWQRATLGLHTHVMLSVGEATGVHTRSNILFVNVDDEGQVAASITSLVEDSGFEGVPGQVVIKRLVTNVVPTYRFDEAVTTERQTQRADAVEPILREIPVGQKIFTRGDELTQAQLELYRAEASAFARGADWWQIWLRRLSVLGAVTAIALAMAGYVTLFCERIRRRPSRMGWIGILMSAALAVACWGTIANPWLIGLTAVAPTLFVSIIIVIAYDQRIALALGALHAVLVCVALDLPIGMLALILTGVGVAVWQLRDIRDRRTLIHMGVRAGFALAIATPLVALVDRPMSGASLLQGLTDAGAAGVGALLAAGVTLFILPTIERTFDITTGMTLIELRDPKQPLLRQLQQQAPGTYNHSLNVASIAEAAADAIAADSLLTYVGALYHDVGKMNKPDYFVENQSGGPNKHDKLSPAMSLLVIVGHVKDGMELAREAGLPRSIQHFIESHHGTLLVEYFYDRARRKAESEEDEDKTPEEFDYRYPGPRPQTKEVAILMLADSVESATRTLSEPTPSRIDTLVRDLANKRLMDGQFDECDLTLRELNTIVESIAKTVASIYHGRIAYPTDELARRA